MSFMLRKGTAESCRNDGTSRISGTGSPNPDEIGRSGVNQVYFVSADVASMTSGTKLSLDPGVCVMTGVLRETF